MNNSFKEYFPFKDDAIKVYEDSIIVLDTNVLLDLYRYNDQNRAKMFEILEVIKDRLYMPHWVAHEFMKNKKDIILEKVEFADNLTQVINKKCNEIRNSFTNSSPITPYLKNEPELRKQLNKLVTKMDEEFKDMLKKHESEFSYSYLTESDPVLDRLTTLYAGRIGKAYTPECITTLSAAGEERYAHSIPPGYKDKKKEPPARYGDYFIWVDMLDYSKAQNTNLLFVSNDLKEDWCELYHNKNLGPRYELRREFYSATDNKLVHFTSSELFIDRICQLHEIEDIEELNIETKILIDNSNDPSVLELELINIEREIEEAEIMYDHISHPSCESFEEVKSFCLSQIENLSALRNTAHKLINQIESIVPEEFDSLLESNARSAFAKVSHLYYAFSHFHESFDYVDEEMYETAIEIDLD
jgi:predicted nucleic acid-binding protein